MTQAGSLQSSLSNGFALKADQSALEALQLEIAGTTTPESLAAALLPYAQTAHVGTQISTTQNTLRTELIALFATKAQVDNLSLALAEKATDEDVASAIATALLGYATTQDLQAAVTNLEGQLAAVNTGTGGALQTPILGETTQTILQLGTARTILQLVTTRTTLQLVTTQIPTQPM